MVPRSAWFRLLVVLWAVATPTRQSLASALSNEQSGGNATRKLLAFDEVDYLDHFLILPEYRILFCSIDKVASQSFTHALGLLRLSNGKPYSAREEKCRGVLASCLGYTKEFLKERIVDETWYKAVFLRDPMERLVSGYQSKCLSGHDADRYICFNQFGGDASHVPSFKHVVEVLTQFEQGPGDPPLNQHWDHQARFCGGLERTIQHYQTVEQLESAATAHEKVMTMLRRVNAPQRAMDEVAASTFTPLPPKMWPWHNTNSHAKLDEYMALLGPGLQAELIKFYSGDYKLLGMHPPAMSAG